MKKQIFPPQLTMLCMILAVVLLLTSCMKSKKVEWPDAAVVTFVHASPKSPLLDVALDNNRLFLRDFSYTSYWNNQNAYIGNRTLSVFKRGQKTALFTKEVSFEKNKHYTIFLADSTAKMEAVVIANATKSAHYDSVRVKFANMCPDVPEMDFYIKGQSAAAATKVAYKSAADFISLRSSLDAVIEVRSSNAPNVLAASIPLRLQGGNIYTIYASGFKGIATGEGRITLSSIRHTMPVYWY